MCRNYTASKVMQFRKRNQRKVFDALRFEVVHEIDPEGSVTLTPQENAEKAPEPRTSDLLSIQLENDTKHLRTMFLTKTHVPEE